MKLTVKKEEQKSSSLLKLAKDPYIMIVCGALIVSGMAISSCEPSLPLWMIQTMNNPPSWQLGLAFLPASGSYLISTILFGYIGHKIGRLICNIVFHGI
jgi:DHA1 family solute carrier family 18 vesicular amine transporter 1/2